jgi:hypothetical protein
MENELEKYADSLEESFIKKDFQLFLNSVKPLLSKIEPFKSVYNTFSGKSTVLASETDKSAMLKSKLEIIFLDMYNEYNKFNKDK